jgi:hypothetical protein
LRGAELPREVIVVRIPTLSFIVVALLAAPSASAQFTGLVAPPPRPAPPVEIVAQAGAVADTTAAARMSDMKAWVDSAAVAVAAQAPPDTATPPVVIQTPMATEAAPQQDVTAFQEGAPAPDTATPLPALVLLGLGLFAGGAALRRR